MTLETLNFLKLFRNKIRASLVAQMVKESACNERELGTIPGEEDPLEKGMATHSSILAWRIPWTEEPGGATVHGIGKSQT